MGKHNEFTLCINCHEMNGEYKYTPLDTRECSICKGMVLDETEISDYIADLQSQLDRSTDE